MLDIDTAIKHCLETAKQLEERANTPYKCEDSELQDNACRECAADHRQLAEWLMELKDLRAEQNDQYTFIRELMDELKEAKRLLKLALQDLAEAEHCGLCKYDDDIPTCQSKPVNCFVWRYADEALKLLKKE